jgi:hypothetical protein
VYFLSNQRNKKCKQTCYGAQQGKVWLRARHSSFWVARLGVFFWLRARAYMYLRLRARAQFKTASLCKEYFFGTQSK